MKKIVYLFLLLILASCKEEEIQPQVDLKSPYVLTDEPDHPVNHKRYLIYKEYGVPVFFTDTLSNVYITKDVKGDSVFAKETLDLNWNFYSVATNKFTFDYLTDEAEQLQALDNIEKYLASSVKSLIPFSIFLVDSFTAADNSNVISLQDVSTPNPRNTVTSLNAYRTLMMSQAHKSFSENYWSTLSFTLLKDQIKKNVTTQAYRTKAAEFESLTDATYFGQIWRNLDKTLPLTFTPAPYRNFNPTTIYPPEEEVVFANLRAVFGQFGFIGLSSILQISPTAEADRNLYIDAILGYDKENFERLWSSQPIVMRKYEIMRDIIVNDMKIPLHEIIK